LERVLDQRKKSNEEHAEDKRKDMSDEKGKQLSIEKATKDTEVKTDDTSIKEDGC
jgi:fumarylacetoacetate (FAA) hydrolase family protein